MNTMSIGKESIVPLEVHRVWCRDAQGLLFIPDRSRPLAQLAANGAGE